MTDETHCENLMLILESHEMADGTAETYHGPEVELCCFRRRVHQQTVRVAAGGAKIRADTWQRAGSDREDCNSIR